MNARESLAADRIAEDAFRFLYDSSLVDEDAQLRIAAALVAIATELRAARVYANYLEGRSGSVRQKAYAADIEERLS